MKISYEDLVRLITQEVVTQLGGAGGVGSNGHGSARLTPGSPTTPFGAEASAQQPSPEQIAQEGFPCNISARHGHLTPEHVEQLFGPGQRLTPFKFLYQEGQFASEQLVQIVGPRGSISNVRILGPERSKSQFEVSRTDALSLGMMPPILQSVNHGTGSPITIVGPQGSIHLPDALIRAKRHVHLHPDEASLLGVKDGDEIPVEIPAGDQGLVFYNVLIRTDPAFKAEMHIDTDEGNAAGVQPGAKALVLSPRAGICRICK
ncbi:MAG: phosphate propanoyltransferase [Abitibacteriaceae bacterium]|nr:phosphate propanoyltransferase [Abditibacteriaceae bacterium]